MPRHTLPASRRRLVRRTTLVLGTAATSLAVGFSGVPSGLLTTSSTSCPAGSSALAPVTRVNLGGPSVTGNGQVWAADPDAPAAAAAAAPLDIAGTTADDLYTTARTGDFTLEVPVPEAGEYVTRLYFAETHFGVAGRAGGPGSRVFTVDVEGGRPELKSFDIAAAVGSQRAVVKSSTNRVRDGALTVTATSIVDAPLVAAVEVYRQLPKGSCSTLATKVATPTTVAAPSTTSATSSAPAPSSSAAPGKAAATTPAPAATSSTPAAAAAAAAAPTSTASAAAPAAQVLSGAMAALTADGGRPFAAGSVWNTPLPANPKIDPKSSAMVASVTGKNIANANIYEYGEPVFTATAGTPAATVDCTESWGSCDVEHRTMRIPADAQPTTGSDGRLIIVDLTDRTVCDFWQAKKTGSGKWSTSWATCAPLDGTGSGASGGSTGAGVNALTGVVRTYEMRAGNIPHTLSVATNNSCAAGHRFPATKSDGQSSRSDCVPEGARLQLDPSIDVAAIPGITPGEVAVAKALQTYGAVNRDNAGAPLVVQFETPFGEADPYPGVGFKNDYYTMPHIPWNKLRVIAG